MNKEEAKQKLHNLAFAKLDTKPDDLKLADVMQIVNQIDEPQAGRAEEAPRYVKNILARLRELPEHDREVWLQAIMNEFWGSFSHAKWREGYEQGKFEGAWVGNQLKDADKIRQELNRPVVKQFVADWYEIHKDSFEPDLFACIRDILNDGCVANISEFEHWILGQKESITTLINMHQFGYTVEKEKRYRVRVKNTLTRQGVLNRNKKSKNFIFSNPEENALYDTKFTRKELEVAGFEWVFDCEGIEIEEVQDDSKI